MKRILLALSVAFFPTLVSAQSTLQSVSTIFQANCTVGCHSGGSPSANLDLSGNPSDLVSALVGVTPTNPAAATKGYKLVDAGYPHKSFLLYKCAYTAWDDQFAMDGAEGNPMPSNQPSLPKEDVELIRQWIIAGAKETGVAVDPQLLSDYYNDNGMARIARPPAPPEGEGFQLHLGPFFLDAGGEVEFYKKEKMENVNVENLVRFDAVINFESHHFLLFEFLPGTSGSVEEGLRPVTLQNAFQDAEYMVGWVNTDTTDLPYGTAYKLDEQAVLDMNVHLINYASNGDSILAAESYVNFYVDNTTPDLIEMHSDLMINLQIPIDNIINPGQMHTFVNVQADNTASPTDSMYVWFLSSHTHKYGKDYDIYMRNPNGSRGEQLYEGWYDTEYGFNQGEYSWEEPANLYLDEFYGEMRPVSRRDGLIQEAKFQILPSDNESAPFINFGLTTDDEMMLAFIQYTLERVPPDPNANVGISEIEEETTFLSVYPNPTNGSATVRFNLDERSNVQLNVYNSLGQEVSNVYTGSMSAGQANFEFNAANGSDPNGLYLIQLVVNDRVYSKRLLHLSY